MPLKVSAVQQQQQQQQQQQTQTIQQRQIGEALRKDFPILHQQVNGQHLVYLDNAATSQKPTVVLNAMDDYYKRYNSNVHRGVHHLAALATTAYEEARQKVATFINAADHREVVYTRNASEAINLVAYSWGMENLKQGDEVRMRPCMHACPSMRAPQVTSLCSCLSHVDHPLGGRAPQQLGPVAADREADRRRHKARQPDKGQHRDRHAALQGAAKPQDQAGQPGVRLEHAGGSAGYCLCRGGGAQGGDFCGH
jgi:hypothetical protein